MIVMIPVASPVNQGSIIVDANAVHDVLKSLGTLAKNHLGPLIFKRAGLSSTYSLGKRVPYSTEKT